VPISDYLRDLRRRVGPALLMVPSVTAIIRDPAGRILLHRRSDDGRWDLPGGAIDPGEAPAEALVREVWEETGLRVVPVRIIGVFGGPNGFRSTYPNGDQVEYTDLLFECRVVGGKLVSRDGEATDFRYFPPADLPAIPFTYPPEVFDPAEAKAAAAFQWKEEWGADGETGKWGNGETRKLGN
jgi:8-oxo-dGTP pyrophosphatase MutT (NUDIX family)